jgi:hypothetical protein
MMCTWVEPSQRLADTTPLVSGSGVSEGDHRGLWATCVTSQPKGLWGISQVTEYPIPKITTLPPVL